MLLLYPESKMSNILCEPYRNMSIWRVFPHVAVNVEYKCTECEMEDISFWFYSDFIPTENKLKSLSWIDRSSIALPNNIAWFSASVSICSNVHPPSFEARFQNSIFHQQKTNLKSLWILYARMTVKIFLHSLTGLSSAPGSKHQSAFVQRRVHPPTFGASFQNSKCLIFCVSLIRTELSQEWSILPHVTINMCGENKCAQNRQFFLNFIFQWQYTYHLKCLSFMWVSHMLQSTICGIEMENEELLLISPIYKSQKSVSRQLRTHQPNSPHHLIPSIKFFY